MSFFGYMWVSLFLFCFSFGLLQVLENFSSWVVGCIEIVDDFCCGYSCYSGNRGSERVSNSLKVMPTVGGKARVKARSVRPQAPVNFCNI